MLCPRHRDIEHPPLLLGLLRAHCLARRRDAFIDIEDVDMVKFESFRSMKGMKMHGHRFIGLCILLFYRFFL